ncbi:actin-like ATPase domain-containing protein [Fusarium circinatum]|uniref:Actin-like ATPase domain-containing protein n=1 Tax=Fusarium circinatum TaxID=48490 RepID=A0A8H5TPZ5_FUSCI|nr:actin-like ATPase domain-containing protein [Fusarium circinatum]
MHRRALRTYRLRPLLGEIEYVTTFEEGNHLRKDRFWDEDQGEYRADNQMEWYLKKGDCVSKSERLSHPVYRIYDTNWDGRFSSTKYQCEETDPPERLESTVEEVNGTRLGKANLDVKFN